MRIPQVYLFLLLATLGPAVHAEPVGRTATDFSFVTAAGPKQIRSYRGNWLLLQFGASWCRPSEYTASVFSDIQRELENKPFKFVELNSDPTLADVDLYSTVDFSGERGLIPASVPPPFDASSFPHWYLIDPQGIIRAAGRTQNGDTLRTQIKQALPRSFGLQADALTPSPRQKQLEVAGFLFVQENYPAARAAFFTLFQQDPRDTASLFKTGQAEAYITDTSVSQKLISKNLPADHILTDSEQVKLADWESGDAGKFKRLERLKPLLPRYPDSVYLRASLIVDTQLPDEMNDADGKLVNETAANQGDYDLRQFLALAFESRDNLPRAFELTDTRHLHGSFFAQTLGLLARHGRAAKAHSTYFKDWPVEKAATANAQQAWEWAFNYAMISDWKGAAAYGARYQQLINDRPLGLEMQWLAAIREKDFPAADALAQKVQTFVETHPKYKVGASAFQSMPPPAGEAMIKGFNVHTRLDNLLPFALLAERQGNYERARETYRTIRSLDDTRRFANALATHLTLTLGK